MCNNDNHLAPVIYVAESLEMANSYKWHSNARMLGSNIQVLDIDNIRRELGKNNDNFVLPYDLKGNDVLIRHPYNQGYILVTKAEDEYIKDYVDGIFLIAGCLGATKIDFQKCDVTKRKRSFDTKNRIEYKEVELGVDIKTNKEAEYKKLFSRPSKSSF